MGMPPEDLAKKIGKGQIPTAPPQVVVGIPADLLRRRPDVRAAERTAAAQAAQIGVAESQFYPHISILGTLDYSSQKFDTLISPGSLSGNVGPSFTWNILNYGRLLNNVRYQDALFQQLVVDYQITVLNAAAKRKTAWSHTCKRRSRLNRRPKACRQRKLPLKSHWPSTKEAKSTSIGSRYSNCNWCSSRIYWRKHAARSQPVW